MALRLKNPHPRDDRIVFDEGPHTYSVDQGPTDEYTSTTTLIHKYFDNFDPVKMSVMCSKNSKSTKYYGRDPEEIQKEWAKTGTDASASGTLMHANIEKYYNGEEHETESDEWKLFWEFHKTIIEGSELTSYRTEWEIFHEKYKIAGSIDMLYQKPNGALVIYDWKRSKEIKRSAFRSTDVGKEPLSSMPNCNFSHYSLQLNIYKYILEDVYNQKIDDMYLVILHPNQASYMRLRVPDLQNDVQLLLQHFIGEYIPMKTEEEVFEGIHGLKPLKRKRRQDPRKTIRPSPTQSTFTGIKGLK